MRLLFFLSLSLLAAQLVAQPADSISTPYPRIKYKSTVVSAPYREVRDEGHSPLFYKGPTFQVAKYNERWRKKSMTKFEMAFGGGIFQTSKRQVSAVTRGYLLNMEINYHYMVPIKKIFKGNGNWYLGGIFTNNFDGRLYPFLPNNSFGYEFSNALNPATHFTYNFCKGKNARNYQAGFKLNFALLAHVIRPNYIGMEPYQAYNDDKIHPMAIFTHNNKIALPNHFMRINTELYLDRSKKNSKDKIRFFYGWGLHVTKLPQSNPLYYISHSIGFVTMLYSEKPARVHKKKLKQ
ncbi:MAG TPA: hypothetical protein VNB90_11345 [Cytophagaceae bacterium]|jgi:hypothetical protein|nr:hypothetical protein [Cytophagaceae bacterium]